MTLCSNALCSFEMSGTTQIHISEDLNRPIHRRVNLEILLQVFFLVSLLRALTTLYIPVDHSIVQHLAPRLNLLTGIQ
jgi:hypothetical protein